jgi:hypothetical protein
MTELLSPVRADADAILAAFNQLSLEEGPRTGREIADIVQQLVHVRDELIAAQRAGTPCGEWLQRVNAIISTIFGTEFPVGGLQWKRVCEAREALKKMIECLPPVDLKGQGALPGNSVLS